MGSSAAVAKAKPVRRRQHDDQLGVDVLAIVGYRAQADDGWCGPVRETYRGAALDAYRHNLEPKQGSSGPRERRAEAAAAHKGPVP